MTQPAHRRRDISDAIWKKLEPHLPGRKGSWGAAFTAENLLGGKGCDTDAILEQAEKQDMKPVIPPKKNRFVTTLTKAKILRGRFSAARQRKTAKTKCARR